MQVARNGQRRRVPRALRVRDLGRWFGRRGLRRFATGDYDRQTSRYSGNAVSIDHIGPLLEKWTHGQNW